jgi:hypothetical protein
MCAKEIVAGALAILCDQDPSSFVSKVVVNGETFVVGTGVYVESAR